MENAMATTSKFPQNVIARKALLMLAVSLAVFVNKPTVPKENYQQEAVSSQRNFDLIFGSNSRVVEQNSKDWFLDSQLNSLEAELEDSEATDYAQLSLSGVLKKVGGRIKTVADFLYFSPKSFEDDGKIYEKIGIKKFQRIYDYLIQMRFILPKMPNRYNVYRLDTENGYKRRLTFSYILESIHLFGFTLSGISLTNYLLHRDSTISPLEYTTYLIINLYAIMSQRHIRGRLLSHRRRKEQIKANRPIKPADLAMKSKNVGGIDLTPANMNLQNQNSGEEIKFHMDPAMLARLQNVPGFTIGRVTIQALKSLPEFLGISN